MLWLTADSLEHQSSGMTDSKKQRPLIFNKLKGAAYLRFVC